MDIYLHCGVLCMKMYIFGKKKKGRGFMSDYSSENIREIYERHFVTVTECALCTSEMYTILRTQYIILL
jgi:hypothetical protein